MKRYSEILAELEALVEKMNRGEISIDELGPAVKTAAKHDCMDMRMKIHCASPCVQDADVAYISPKILFIGGEIT